MNRHTIRVLEFEPIRRRVCDRALTEEAGAALKRERILTDSEAIAALKAEVGVLRTLLNSTERFPTVAFPPVSEPVARVSKEGIVLESVEIADIGSFTRSTLLLVEYLTRAAVETGRSDALSTLLGTVPDVRGVADHIARFVDPDGSVREREIPELRAARAEIGRAQQELQRTAQTLAGRDDLRRFWSTTVATQRNGRTVLPLKSDHRGKVKGIIHEVSSTGATVFIEPEELVSRNNAVVEAENRYQAELLRILRELSAFCRVHHAQLHRCVEFMTAVDRLLARARYCNDIDATPADESGGAVRLVSARHPLLGDHAVPITIEIEEPTRALIVTGPNTGGKTVSLKTIGLFALMNQFGLHVPASAGTALPVFSGIYADIGDEQSIEQNLSTFSGHMRNIGRLLHQVDDRSLVLLDELGSGTDPEEGGALAMSIMDELLARRPITVVTTHHGQLKHYGFTNDEAANASVEFDRDSLRPTFRIIPGVPGSSHAIDVASQMGLLRSVTAGARRYLTGEEYDTGRIIRRLTEREQELHLEREAAQRAAADLDRERERIAERDLELELREQQLRDGRLKELDAWAGEVRSRLENLVREIREGELTRDKTQSVKRFITDIDEHLEATRSAAVRTRPTRKTKRRVAAARVDEGVAVRVRSTGQRGVVQRKGKQESWIVQVGQVRIPVDEDDLEPIDVRPERPSIAYSVTPTQARMELDLRGLRLEEAIQAVDRQIDAALIGGLDQFGVIHGMGEGILQKGVRDHLREHTAIADIDYALPEDGGYGKTNVRLRQA